jgi:aminoglycoside phosphotransferase (APT) family kinase protein
LLHVAFDIFVQYSYDSIDQHSDGFIVFPTGISDRGLVQLGIPTVEEVMGQYCSSMGLEEGVPDWNFYMAFHLFCLAASHQGESKSTIAGTRT